MRAALIHDADPPGAVAKRDQLLAQQHEPHRIAVGFELASERGRDPVLPHELAHHGAGSDPGQLIAIARLAHGPPPGAAFPKG